MGASAVAKVAGNVRKNLSEQERQPYERQAASLKEKYDQELKKYKDANGSAAEVGGDEESGVKMLSQIKVQSWTCNASACYPFGVWAATWSEVHQMCVPCNVDTVNQTSVHSCCSRVCLE